MGIQQIQRWSNYVTITVYQLLLFLAYIKIIAPWYEYAGMEYKPNNVKILEIIIPFIIIIGSMPVKIIKISQFYACLNVFLFYIPVNVFYCIGDKSRTMYYAVTIITLASFLVAKIPNIKLATLSIRIYKHQKEIFLILIGLTLYLMYKINPGNFTLSMESEYLNREIAAEEIGKGSINYIIGWLPTIIGPVALILSLITKKYKLTVSIILLHIIWAGIISHKTPAFVPFIILFIWYFQKYLEKTQLLPICLSSLLAVSISLYWIFDYLWMIAVIIRRVLFVPIQLMFSYFDYFESRDAVLWKNIYANQKFLSGEYDEGYQQAIGAFIGIGGHANAGFYATGYMHAKIIGLIAYGIFFLVILYFLDSLTRNQKKLLFPVAVTIIPMMILINSSDMTTAFLSHGLLLSFLILYSTKLEVKIKN